MKKKTFKRLTHEQQAELKSLAALRDDAIDSSDAPELVDWSGAKRGLFYRRVKARGSSKTKRALSSVQSHRRGVK